MGSSSTPQREIILTCAKCNAPFAKKNVKGPTPTYCSKACMRRARRQRLYPERLLSKPCPICSVLFHPVKGSMSCGSKKCQRALDTIKYGGRRNAVRAQWAKDNPEKQNSYKSRSVSKRPEHYREMAYLHSNRWRTRKAGNGGSHTTEEWNKVKELAGFRCLRCSAPESIKPLTKDHIVPVSMGGTDNIDNIQPLCRSCNASKCAQFIDYRRAA